MLEIGNIALKERPLVVCDIDDVVLDFIGPFQTFLGDSGYRLEPRSFRLHGNIVCATSEDEADRDRVNAMIAAFFDSQETWQVPLPGAADALRHISEVADIVFLTAMKPMYYAQRRRLLDINGLPYPLLATEEPKGPLVRQLHRDRGQPIAFIDDMVRNLESVGEHVSGCLLVHMAPESEIHRFAPPTPDHAHRAEDWHQADTIIREHFAA